MKYKVIVTVVLLALAATGFHFKNRALQSISNYLQPHQEDPVPTLRLKKQNYSVIVTSEGELTGFQTTPILTPQVRTGSLKIAWMADEGSIVKAGDAVVHFDNTDAQLSLEQNKNTLSSYNYRIQKAENDGRSQTNVSGIDRREADLELDFAQNQVKPDETIFSRWQIQEAIMSAALALYKTGNVESKRTLNQGVSQADVRILNIDSQKAKTEMNLAQQTLASLEVKAPAEGVVLYRRFGFFQLQVGSDAWPGQPILDIANLRQFKGRLQVVESDIAGIEKEKNVELALTAYPNRRFQGKIQQVATAAQQVSRRDPRKYFTCEVLLEVPLELMDQLKPGMRLTGRIHVGQRKGALVVPKSAIFKKESDFVVFVKRGDQYNERKVRILDTDHGFHVIDGPQEGDEICLQHPFEKQKLHLPDFSAPSAATQGRRFMVFF
ncbi:MAG TPA: efflux RND transporter periplasmic adaptor subunit [Acidobacteriota bacterium]|jgi:RND family efflux transporter MFP subunit|nr:efflux RND transporter periplasmic adaptor subunit [Acidobacteriota bacterium]